MVEAEDVAEEEDGSDDLLDFIPENQLKEEEEQQAPPQVSTDDQLSDQDADAEAQHDVFDEEDVFLAEKIVDKRRRRGRGRRGWEYLVKWAGYDDSFNTWEPAENILDPKLIDDFEQRQ